MCAPHISQDLNNLPLEPNVVVCVEREHGIYKACSRELTLRFGDTIKLVHCSTAKEALDHLSSAPADLVISSLLQAEIEGIDLLNTCKDLYPRLPFMFYTVLEYKEAFFTWGHKPDAYVVVSPDFSGLTDTVARLLDIKQS
jgi:DNA-binding NtrC family response regulator